MPGYRTLRKAIAVLFLAALQLAFFSSCKKKLVWHDDFDAALKAAEAQDRHVFALFSGEDWDGRTEDFRANVLESNEFQEFARDGYVLLNVDLSEAERANVLLGEDAGNKEKEQAAQLQSTIDAKADLMRRYGVSSYPSIYILSKEGYVLSIIHYDEGLVSTSVLREILEEQGPSIAGISSAIVRVLNSSGVQKATAIDALYEATPEAGRKPLSTLIREVPSLDPSDASGLVGKYEFITAYEEALEHISEGQRDGVVESFVNIAENGHLGPAQKLEAYHNAAYLMALFGDSDYDRMYELLQKAQEVDPENARMEDIEHLMAMVSKFRDIMQQDEGPFSAKDMKDN